MSGFDTTAEVERFDEAVEWFADRFPVTEQLRDALGQYAGARAWTIAGVTQLDAVMAAHELLGKAIEKGWSTDHTVEELKRVLSAYSFTGNRLGGIVRTNVQLAYNAGRYQQMSDPDLMELRPYRQLDGIDDFRQSDICRSRDGITLPAKDPFWLTCWPPLHHGGCRTVVRSLAKWELDDVPESKLSLPPNLPKVSPGFGLAPDVGMPWRPDLSKYPTRLSNAYRDKEADAARKAREKAAKLRAAKEAKRRAAEEAERIAQEKAAKLESERLEKERQDAAEKARKESERIAREYRLAEEKRRAKEAAEKAERERLEAERAAKEEAERLERERLEREAEKRRRIEREKAERKAAEEAKRAEEARKADEARRAAEAQRKAEQERQDREEAEQKRDPLAYRFRKEAEAERDKSAEALAKKQEKKSSQMAISAAKWDLENAEQKLARINKAAEIRSRIQTTGDVKEAQDARLLTPDQRQAVKDFTGSSFGSIRRTQSDPKLAKKREFKHYAAQGRWIEEAIEQNVKFEGEVWRGICVHAEDAEKILNSGVISWGGKSTSASLDRKTSERFSNALSTETGILFHVRNGRGLSVSDLGIADEQEIIQSGSSMFRVLSKSQQGNRWVIELEQVHDKSAIEQLKRDEDDRQKRAAEEQKRLKKEAEKAAKEEAKRAEAERRRKEEERKAREEAERCAKEEAERKARELAEQKAKEEAERKAAEAKKKADDAAKARVVKAKPFYREDAKKLQSIEFGSAGRLSTEEMAAGKRAGDESKLFESLLSTDESDAVIRFTNGYDATIRKIQLEDPSDQELFEWRREHKAKKLGSKNLAPSLMETEKQTREHIKQARAGARDIKTALDKWRTGGKKSSVGTVFRGLGGVDPGLLGKWVESGEFDFRGQTTSASWSPQVGGMFLRNNTTEGKWNILLKIRTKSGVPIERMSDMPGEHELLMPGEAKFRITSVKTLTDETKFNLPPDSNGALGNILIEAEEI